MTNGQRFSTWNNVRCYAPAVAFAGVFACAVEMLDIGFDGKKTETSDRKEKKVERIETKKYGKVNYHEAIKEAEGVLRRFKEERGVPGMSVGVSVDGRITWKTGYGYSDVENLLPCTSDSVMRIASISKCLTMTLVAKLMQEKLLDLDAPVQKYVPAFPQKEFNGEKVVITTRHVVSHLGGIRHYQKLATKSSETTAVTANPSGAVNQNAVDAIDSKPATPTVEKWSTYEIGAKAQQPLCENCQKLLKDSKPQPVSEFQYVEYYSQKQYDSVTEALSMFKDDPLIAKPGNPWLFRMTLPTPGFLAGTERHLPGRVIHIDRLAFALTRVSFLGTKYAYTTHGWTLVSAVAEGASGKKFPDLLKDLFAILGMRQTFLDENYPLIPNRTSYYRRRSATKYRLENVPPVNNSYKWAGGGVVSTVGDLLSFANALLYFYHRCPAGARTADCYLDRKTLNEIWKPLDIAPVAWAPGGHYAMGWAITPDRTLRRDGEFFVSHTGGAIGASSVLLLKPTQRNETESSGLAVAVLTNLQECGGLHLLAVELAEIFDRAHSQSVDDIYEARS